MQILILGYSQITRRRVIPAIEAISDFTGIDIASRSSASSVILPEKLKGEVFADYQKALSESKADIVYISTTNNLHTRLAQEALLKGFHVIVDKPAFLSFEDAKGLVDLAKKKKRCLAEATVYAYHPQIERIKEVFLAAKSQPARLTAILSFPPLDPDNFRYVKDLGGGALYDLGPYAISPGRLFFGEEPREIYCTVNSRGGRDGVDTAFSVLAVYSGGRSLAGHFGFDTGYCNLINILGPGVSLEMERIFTIPPDMENEIKTKQGMESKVLRVPSADCFALFLEKVVDSIKRSDYEEFANQILSDAAVLKRLRQVALEEKK